MNKIEELKLELKNYMENNKPLICYKKVKTDGYGEIIAKEEIYRKEVKEEIERLEAEIYKEEIKESISALLDSTSTEDTRVVVGAFHYIDFIIKSKKINPDVLLEILNAVVLSYKMEEGYDFRPLVVSIMALLKKFRFDEGLTYSVNV